MGAEQRSLEAGRMGGGLASACAVAALCLLALGCFTQKPSSESAPSAAPEAPPPGADVETAPPAPAAKPAEENRERPSLGGDAPARGSGAGAAAPAPAPATAPLVPEKPAAKARRQAQPEADQEGDDRAAGAEEAQGDRLRQRLDRAYRAGSPNCPAARDRKKAVCDLAAQICQLIDRDPNVASVAEYCADAKERCAEAQRRTEERCPD
jgi:hypothetical protein